MTNQDICLKCGHNIDSHKIQIIGRYDYMEVSCREQGDDYDVTCDCDAGFNKVAIKKEFTVLEREKKQ